MTTIVKIPEKINNQIKLLIQVFVSQNISAEKKHIFEINLYAETIRFMEKLSDEINYDLTVDDIRLCLDALELHCEKRERAQLYSPQLQSLLQIWIDKLTLFS